MDTRDDCDLLQITQLINGQIEVILLRVKGGEKTTCLKASSILPMTSF